MTGMTKVLVVDDQSAIRKVLRKALERDGSFVVDEARDGREALERSAAEPPDVVIMDLSMPGLSGLEAIGVLATRVPRPKIVVLSGHSDRSDEATGAGADIFMSKATPARSLIKTLHLVLGGSPSP